MNLLFVVVDPDLYKHYAGNKAYPNGDYPFPNEVPDVPNYTGTINSNDCATKKCTPTGWCQRSATTSST